MQEVIYTLDIEGTKRVQWVPNHDDEKVTNHEIRITALEEVNFPFSLLAWPLRRAPCCGCSEKVSYCPNLFIRRHLLFHLIQAGNIQYVAFATGSRHYLPPVHDYTLPLVAVQPNALR